MSMEHDFNSTVKLWNNMRMHVIGKGIVRIQVDGITQMISDVYYVPEFKNNLLSIGKLQEKSLAILIRDGVCKVFHSEKGLIMKTNMSGNIMFYLLASIPRKDSMCLQAEEEALEKEAHT